MLDRLPPSEIMEIFPEDTFEEDSKIHNIKISEEELKNFKKILKEIYIKNSCDAFGVASEIVKSLIKKQKSCIIF